MGKEIRAILVGLGVVGSALAHAILSERYRLGATYGFRIKVVAVADSRSTALDKHGLNLKEVLDRKLRTGLVGNPDDPVEPKHLIDETEADVLIEVTPGKPSDAEPGLSHIRTAIKNGVDVVTANKMPLALHYGGLMSEASVNGRLIKYGACVGGGLPVIEFGELCGAADEVTGIEGVLNATSNFILSEMEQPEMSFSSALGEARRLGYAEADASLDTKGIDAACKIVILANHVLGKDFTLRNVHPLDGIRGISPARITKAQRRGKRLRMIASAGEGVSVRVAEIPATDPICVPGPDNAVRFCCKRSGVRVIEGPAGGGATTSTAVLRDLISIGRTRFGG